MTIYLACIDQDGTMRSSCDPEKAFVSKEKCQQYLDQMKASKWGYCFELKEIELDGSK